MTEEAYFSSVAQKEAFKELDVEKYEIVAKLDSHTSDICLHMDGKVYDMKEYEAGVTAPPFHVFCRSTTVPYFDDDFGVIGERAARDENGKTYNVPADMTYEEWEKQFVDKKVVAKSSEGGIMKMKGRLSMNLQLFAESAIKNQTIKELQKGIKTFKKKLMSMKDT